MNRKMAKAKAKAKTPSQYDDVSKWILRISYDSMNITSQHYEQNNVGTATKCSYKFLAEYPVATFVITDFPPFTRLNLFTINDYSVEHVMSFDRPTNTMTIDLENGPHSKVFYFTLNLWYGDWSFPR